LVAFDDIEKSPENRHENARSLTKYEKIDRIASSQGKLGFFEGVCKVYILLHWAPSHSRGCRSPSAKSRRANSLAGAATLYPSYLAFWFLGLRGFYKNTIIFGFFFGDFLLPHSHFSVIVSVSVGSDHSWVEKCISVFSLLFFLAFSGLFRAVFVWQSLAFCEIYETGAELLRYI